MSPTTLAFAPHVGTYVAAAAADGGARLAVVLASGPRGDHRVCVHDTASWAVVHTFAIPGRARSGVTPIVADGARLFVGDDHGVTAFDLDGGQQVWARAFAPATRARLLDARDGRVLVSLLDADQRATTALLRAADGGDEAVLALGVMAGVEAAALGPGGLVAVAGMKMVDVAGPGAPTRRLPVTTRRYGAIDAAAIDDDGHRLVLGSRAGEVVVMDLDTGAAATVLELDDAVRSVGFVAGAPWALDAAGRLRAAGADGARVHLDLGRATSGGIVADDGATLSYGDERTRTFRVCRLPGGDEVFATLPGFVPAALAIAPDGALLVADDARLLRVDPDTGAIARVGEGAHELARLADGTIVRIGAEVAATTGGTTTVIPVFAEAEDVAVAGGAVAAMASTVAELWDVATGHRTWAIDLDDTWLGETGEAVRLVHLGPDGRPWLHLSDGAVYRGDALDDAGDALAGRLPPDGMLWLHPAGTHAYRAHGAQLTPITLDGLTEAPPLALAHDADVAKLVFSPSGRRLVVFHRDGRLSTVDLQTGASAVVASPETSAAERAPHELYAIDLGTPMGCAFGRDEATIAWTHAGGVTFADATSGRLAGRLMISTSGQSYLVTDGDAFDTAGPPSPELVALDDDVALDDAALAARTRRGLLATLTR